MTSDGEQAEQFFAELVRVSQVRADKIRADYRRAADKEGRLAKKTLHRYVCRRGCGVLATVVKLGEDVLVETRDYKLAPGMNLERSVPDARRKNTLDGDRHWPGHTFDVRELANWALGFDASCRHGLHTLLATDVLATIEGVRPGHQEKPTLL